MAQEPGTRIIEERDHGLRIVNGIRVRVFELVWNDIDYRKLIW